MASRLIIQLKRSYREKLVSGWQFFSISHDKCFKFASFSSISPLFKNSWQKIATGHDFFGKSHGQSKKIATLREKPAFSKEKAGFRAGKNG